MQVLGDTMADKKENHGWKTTVDRRKMPGPHRDPANGDLICPGFADLIHLKLGTFEKRRCYRLTREA